MTYFSYPIRRLILLCITAFSLIGCIQNGERIDLGGLIQVPARQRLAVMHLGDAV